jgi:hypothetical protein
MHVASFQPEKEVMVMSRRRSDVSGLVGLLLGAILIISGCGGGGGGSDSGGGGTTPTTPPSPTGTVSLTVSGTTITAFSGDDAVASDSTQGKTMDVDRDGDGINDAYRLTLRNIPLNQNLRIYLESKGTVYSLYFADGTGATNVFSLGSEAPFDFGFITLFKGTAGNSATPERSPCAAGGLLCAAAIASIPAALPAPP